MSVQAISLAYAVQGVTSAEKFLLVTLANYADQNLKCWPSQRRLAADTHLSIRTMVSLFKSLEAKGLIYREPRARRRSGARDSLLITLKIHSEAIAPRTETNVQSTTEPKCNPPQNHSAITSPKPSLEPLDNRQRAREARDVEASSRALAPKLKKTHSAPKETPQQMAARIRALAN